MAGSTESGKRAAITMKEEYGEDYYSKIAAKTTKAWKENGRKPRGFAAVPGLAKRASEKAHKRKKKT